MLLDTRSQWSAMISSSTVRPWSDVVAGATTYLAGANGLHYGTTSSYVFGSGSDGVRQQNNNGFMNVMGSLTLMYVLNSNNSGSITYRTKITDLMDIWPQLRADQPVADGYNQAVNLNSAFMNMTIAMDHIHEDLSSVKISSYQAMMDSWVAYSRTQSSSWALNNYGAYMTYELYRGTSPAQVAIDTACYHALILGNDTVYPPAVCDMRQAYRGLSSEIQPNVQLNTDGVSGSGPSYTWERLGGGSREKLGKWGGIHVAVFTGADTSYTTEPKMATFYEWLFSGQTNPWNAKVTFSDTANNQSISTDYFQDLDTIYPGNGIFLVKNAHLAARKYSSLAGNLADRSIAISTITVVYPGELIDYVLITSSYTSTTQAVDSKVVRYGGAAFWDEVDQSTGALMGVLNNAHLTKNDHYHASDFNGLYLAGYGESLLSNVGTQADPNVGVLGFSRYWHQDNAHSGNVLLFGDRNYAQDTGRAYDNSYNCWNPIVPYVSVCDNTPLYGGDGITESLLSNRFDYAVGLATSPYVFRDTTTGTVTQTLGEHKRNFIFIHPDNSVPGYWIVGDEAQSFSSSTVNVTWHPYGIAPSTTTSGTEWDWLVSTRAAAGTDVHLNLFLATPPLSVAFSSSPFGGNPSFVASFMNAQYAVDASSNARVITVLYPSDPTHAKATMTRLAPSGATGALIQSGTILDYVAISSPSSTVTTGGGTYQGRMSWIRRNASGMLAYFVRQGTSFDDTAATRTGFSSPVPVSLHMLGTTGTITSTGTAITFYSPGVVGVSFDGVPVSGTATANAYTVSVASGNHSVALSSTPVTATNIYFAQSSAGANDGTSCANAYSVFRFNTADSNWTAGNTLHLCGTFTGTAGATVLTTQGSGSAGNPITLLFEAGAIVEAPYLNGTNGGVFCNSHSYITIDGGSNGTVRNTLNGTALFNQQTSRGIHSTGCDNLTIKNMTVADMYIRTENSSDTTDTFCIGNRNSSNVLISSNTLHHCRMAILETNNQASTTETGITISSNTISFASAGMGISAVGSGGVLDDVEVFNNDLGGGAYLWDHPTNEFHHDPIHVFQGGVGLGTVTNLRIYNNYFHGIWSRDTVYAGSHITSPVFLESVGTGSLIFNNVFDFRTDLNMPSNGLIYCKSTDNCKIYNNTFHLEDDAGVAIGTAIQIAGTTADIQNNIFHKTDYAIYTPGGSVDVSTSNRNVFWEVSAYGESFDNFAGWQGDGKDLNSITTDPQLSTTTYQLPVGSPAIGLGANLTGLGIAALNVDKSSVARHASLAWDAGAYQSPRATLSFSPSSATFTSRETMPAGFGVPIVIVGSGTWTEQADSPTTCGGTISNWSDGEGNNALTSIVATSTPTTYWVRPNLYQTSTCAKGEYVVTVPFTNGADTVNFTVNLNIVYRLAASVYFNGYGIADSSLTTYGWSQGTLPAGQFSYNLNKKDCPTCNPLGTSTMTAILTPGSTWIDDLGNTVTVLTPPSYSNYNAGKSVLNSDNSLAIASVANGIFAVFRATGQAVPDWPSLNDGVDFGSSGGFGWATNDPNVLYSIIGSGFKGANLGTFKELTLTTPGNYTMATGPGQTSGDLFVLSGKGRYMNNGPARGDVNSLDWMSFATMADYQSVVNISSNIVTWVSGDQFDSKLLDQSFRDQYGNSISAILVSSVTSATSLVLDGPPGDLTGSTNTFVVPWYLCSVNFPDMKAQGTAYAPICGDFTAMARPRVNYYQGGVFSSIGTDPVSGHMYTYYGNFPYDVVGYFTPGVSSSMTLVRGAIATNDYFGAVCDDSAARNEDPGRLDRTYRCNAGSHSFMGQMSDGSQWLLYGEDGLTPYRLRDLAAGTHSLVYEAGGFFTQLQYGNYIDWGFGSARKAPYSIISSGRPAYTTSYQVTNCTNASPAVLTLDSAPSFTTGTDNILINNVRGNTACNGIHDAVAISGNDVTLEVAGNGVYEAGYGALTANTTAAWDGNETDQTFVFRDLGIEAHRVGHTRSVQFSNDHFATNFWGVPRANLSMDGKCVVYATTWGIPENLQLMKSCIPTIGGIGMLPNMFDLTHSVTSVSVTPSSATFNYSTPDTGNVILDVCESYHLPDVPGGSSPDPSCQTKSSTSGANPRTTQFTGLTEGQPYNYRIVANNQWLAYGTFTPAEVAAPTAGSASLTGNVMFSGGVSIK